ncbi:carboxylesterase family protein [Spongiimicrobium salis]|uniref:carboxylesterase family protein n=1 Tax=Spongiimicrobium salis TaxID=1667022 RepID=UPI00374CE1BF
MRFFLLLIVFQFFLGCSSNNDIGNKEIANEEIANEETENDDGQDELPDTTAVDLGIIIPGTQQAYINGTTGLEYGFHLYTPAEYDTNGEDEFPLLVYLHGSGSRGDSSVDEEVLDVILLNGPARLIDRGMWNPEQPMVVVSPQSPTTWNTGLLHDFIGLLAENLKIDRERIYMTGYSMGGRGCFDYISDFGNDSYAAVIVPIAGWGNEQTGNQFVNTPVWAFHGHEDKIITYDSSVNMVNAINNENPETLAKLTIYPEVGHGSWARTYDSSGIGTENSNYDPFDMTIYEWMYQFKKR